MQYMTRAGQKPGMGSPQNKHGLRHGVPSLRITGNATGSSVIRQRGKNMTHENHENARQSSCTRHESRWRKKSYDRWRYALLQDLTAKAWLDLTTTTTADCSTRCVDTWPESGTVPLPVRFRQNWSKSIRLLSYLQHDHSVHQRAVLGPPPSIAN
jgi:hypothetical protein